MKTSCPICQNTKIESEVYKFNEIRHGTFEIINKEANVFVMYQCKSCMHIFKIKGKEEEQSISQYMQSNVYELNTSMEMSLVSENAALSKRVINQKNWITQIAKINGAVNADVLDYGCNEGDLLRALKEYPGSPERRYYGFDIIQRPSFIKRSGGAIFIEDINSIPDKSLDIVCLSHSLIYEKRAVAVIRALSKKLTAKGFVWLQNPNPKRSSIYLLGDQCNFFQEDSSKKMFDLVGLKAQTVSIKGESNETICIASRHGLEIQGVLSLEERREDSVTIKSIKLMITKIKKQLAACSERENNAAYILGRTSSAALTCQIMKDSAEWIIDESKNDSKLFHGKKVINSVNAIKYASTLVIPIFANGQTLASRIKQQRKDLKIKSVKC